jgi:hypothetical protein
VQLERVLAEKHPLEPATHLPCHRLDDRVPHQVEVELGADLADAVTELPDAVDGGQRFHALGVQRG